MQGVPPVSMEAPVTSPLRLSWVFSGLLTFEVVSLFGVTQNIDYSDTVTCHTFTAYL